MHMPMGMDALCNKSVRNIACMFGAHHYTYNNQLILLLRSTHEIQSKRNFVIFQAIPFSTISTMRMNKYIVPVICCETAVFMY